MNRELREKEKEITGSEGGRRAGESRCKYKKSTMASLLEREGSEERSSVSEQRSSVSEQQSSVSEQQSSVCDQLSSVSEHRSSVNNQGSSVSEQ